MGSSRTSSASRLFALVRTSCGFKARLTVRAKSSSSSTTKTRRPPSGRGSAGRWAGARFGNSSAREPRQDHVGRGAPLGAIVDLDMTVMSRHHVAADFEAQSGPFAAGLGVGRLENGSHVSFGDTGSGVIDRENYARCSRRVRTVMQGLIPCPAPPAPAAQRTHRQH